MPKPTFTAFYRANRDALLRFVRHYGGPALDTEDIVAESFARTYAKWITIDDPRAWLYRVAINITHHAGRDLQRQSPVEDPFGGHETSITWRSNVKLPSAEWWAVIHELQGALQELPTQQRAAVLLEYQGWSRQEIAVVLDCTTITVRGHLHRGRARLKRLLDEPAEIPHTTPHTGVEGRPA